MTETDFHLLRPLDPQAVLDTLRFQGALTVRLTERLGEDAVGRAFEEVARFELPREAEKFRLPLVSGQTHLLGSDSERRWAKAAQSQMLRSLCRSADENAYHAAYHQAVDDAVEGANHDWRLTALKRSLEASGALLGDPNSNLPAPPEHGPLFKAEFDLLMHSFRPRP